MKIAIYIIIIFQFILNYSFSQLKDYVYNSPDGKVVLSMSKKERSIIFYNSKSVKEQKYIISRLEGFNSVFIESNMSCIEANNKGKGMQNRLSSMLHDVDDIKFISPVLCDKHGNEFALTDEIILKFKSNPNSKEIEELERNYGVKVKYKLDFGKNIFMISSYKGGLPLIGKINELLETNLFLWVEPNSLMFGSLSATVNDPIFVLGYQWSYKNKGYSSYLKGADMKITQAWDISTGHPNIKIAVLDVGVELSHPDLSANLLVGYDATYIEGDTSKINSHGNHNNNEATHGTNASGIIAAVGNNSKGIAGIAYNSRIIPIRIGFQFGTSNFIVFPSQHVNAINWAWKNGNADIISNSYGVSPSQIVKEAIDSATIHGRNGKGCLVFGATGNYNITTLLFPASYEPVIAVGGTNKNDQRFLLDQYSGGNYGTGTDVSAPGVSIWTTRNQELLGPGLPGYYYPTGTSFSCPAAAGVMALILSVDSTLTARQAREILEITSDKVGGYEYNSYVSGQPNGSWSYDLGYGRINAYKALLKAQVYNSYPNLCIEELHISSDDDIRLNCVSKIDSNIISISYINLSKGLNVGDTIHYGYSINNTICQQNSIILSESFGLKDIMKYEFSKKTILSDTGEYIIKAWVNTPGDINNINDTIISNSIMRIEKGALSLPLNIDFENWDDVNLVESKVAITNNKYFDFINEKNGHFAIQDGGIYTSGKVLRLSNNGNSDSAIQYLVLNLDLSIYMNDTVYMDFDYYTEKNSTPVMNNDSLWIRSGNNPWIGILQLSPGKESIRKIDLSNFLESNGQSLGTCVQVKFDSECSGLYDGFKIDNIKIYGSNSLSISEKKMYLDDIIIYPNPFSDKCLIQFNRIFNEDINCKIISSDGTVLKDIDVYDNSLNLDLKSYSKGVYFVLIRNKKNSYIRKIVKY